MISATSATTPSAAAAPAPQRHIAGARLRPGARAGGAASGSTRDRCSSMDPVWTRCSRSGRQRLPSAAPTTLARSMDAATWVIIPTYNEAVNLERIVARRVRRAGPGGRRRLPDPRRRRRLARRHRRDRRRARRGRSRAWRCCTAPDKAGLGAAYLAGLRSRARAPARERVIEMDADFSHDPALPAGAADARPRMPTSCSARAMSPAGACATGACCASWSAAAAGSTRGRSCGVEVHDLTGGFKCIRREVLEAIDLPSVRAEGYVFQIEVTYRAILAGFTRPRGPDRVRRPDRGQVEDVGADRARGDLARARAQARGAPVAVAPIERRRADNGRPRVLI